MQLYREIEVQMKQAVDHLHEEMKQLRTGRASLAVLDGVTVDYYGTPTRTASDARPVRSCFISSWRWSTACFIWISISR